MRDLNLWSLGIKNKILAVPVRNGALEEETLACSTGETEFDVPYR